MPPAAIGGAAGAALLSRSTAGLQVCGMSLYRQDAAADALLGLVGRCAASGVALLAVLQARAACMTSL